MKMSVHWKKENKEKLAKEFNTNLSYWVSLNNDRANITGKLPRLREKLSPNKTNAELSKEWGVTPRMASRIRNHQRPHPDSLKPAK
jgi:hypothetical protein